MALFVPYQADVEQLGRHHGGKHHKGKVYRGQSWGNLGDIGAVHRHQNDDDKNVYHRPTADEFNKVVHFTQNLGRQQQFVFGAVQQNAHHDDFGNWNHQADSENNDSNQPVVFIPQNENPIYHIALHIGCEAFGAHHGIDIGGDE